MGRMSKRSLAIKKGWETRKANLQSKMMRFQETKMNEQNQSETVVDPSQSQLPFAEAAPQAESVQAATLEATPVIENRVSNRKLKKRPIVRGVRVKEPATLAAPRRVDFDSISDSSYTFDQIRELGAKAIFDGQTFRLLKHNGSVVFAR